MIREVSELLSVREEKLLTYGKKKKFLGKNKEIVNVKLIVILLVLHTTWKERLDIKDAIVKIFYDS